MLKSKTLKIGGMDFEVTPEPYGPAQELLFRVLKSTGPALIELLCGSKTRAEIGDEVLKTAALRAIQDLTFAETKAIEAILAKSTRITLPDGKRPFLDSAQNLAFDGEIMRWLGWYRFALEVNFKGFFDSMGLGGVAP